MISTANDIDPGQLSAFLAVIEEGSFERAARRLHVTSSAISQRVKQLEVRIGHILVRRESPCVATPAGESLLRYGKQMQLLTDQALTELAEPFAHPSTIAIAVNADSLATWFIDAMAPLTRHGEQMFELLVDDQEHTAEMLRAGRVMAAVTSEPTPVRGCRVVRLGTMRYVAVASPDYIARHFPRGVSQGSLAEAPSLTFNRKDTLQRQMTTLLGGDEIAPPIHWIPSSHCFITAALEGIGWGMVPARMADTDLRSGHLRRIHRRAVLDVPLFWQHWSLDTPLLTRLTRSVETAAQTMNRPVRSRPPVTDAPPPSDGNRDGGGPVGSPAT